MSETGPRVLFVCLGNICRSPTAEGVLRHLAFLEAPALKLTIDSAGTGGYHIGAAPDRRAQRAALARGIDISDLRARRVSPEDFRRFDLILAMDHDNLADLNALRPRGSLVQPELFLDYAPGLEGSDVPDPYQAQAQVFDDVLDLCFKAARGLLAHLQDGAQQPVQTRG